MVIVEEAECWIVDVTITSDIFSMSGPYQQQISYYNEEEILHWAKTKWPGHLISTKAVVLNWRRSMYGHSGRILRELGVNQFDTKIMAVRLLTFTHSMFRHYARSTVRGRPTILGLWAHTRRKQIMSFTKHQTLGSREAKPAADTQADVAKRAG